MGGVPDMFFGFCRFGSIFRAQSQKSIDQCVIGEKTCCDQRYNTRVYMKIRECYSTLRMGNRIVSLPCIDTPEGGREVRPTVVFGIRSLLSQSDSSSSGW